jgi:hypothetical protein
VQARQHQATPYCRRPSSRRLRVWNLRTWPSAEGAADVAGGTPTVKRPADAVCELAKEWSPTRTGCVREPAPSATSWRRPCRTGTSPSTACTRVRWPRSIPAARRRDCAATGSAEGRMGTLAELAACGRTSGTAAETGRFSHGYSDHSIRHVQFQEQRVFDAHDLRGAVRQADALDGIDGVGVSRRTNGTPATSGTAESCRANRLGLDRVCTRLRDAPDLTTEPQADHRSARCWSTVLSAILVAVVEDEHLPVPLGFRCYWGSCRCPLTAATRTVQPAPGRGRHRRSRRGSVHGSIWFCIFAVPLGECKESVAGACSSDGTWWGSCVG